MFDELSVEMEAQRSLLGLIPLLHCGHGTRAYGILPKHIILVGYLLSEPCWAPPRSPRLIEDRDTMCTIQFNILSSVETTLMDR